MSDLDSRLRSAKHLREIGRFQGVKVIGEPLFCTSCGRHDGYTPVQMPDDVIYLCGNCETAHGVPPEMFTKRPDLDEMRSTG